MFENLHPAWKVCIGMAIVLFVTLAAAGRVLLMQQESIRGNQDFLERVFAQQKRGEERSYISRAIGCSDIINDGEIELTDECTDARVAVYYAPSLCDKLPITLNSCGSEATVIKDLGG